MSGERKTPPADPTSERTTDQSSQTAGGLTTGREKPARGAEGTREHDVDDQDRDRAGTSDPALPADDATLKTNI